MDILLGQVFAWTVSPEEGGGSSDIIIVPILIVVLLLISCVLISNLCQYIIRQAKKLRQWWSDLNARGVPRWVVLTVVKFVFQAVALVVGTLVAVGCIILAADWTGPQPSLPWEYAASLALGGTLALTCWLCSWCIVIPKIEKVIERLSNDVDWFGEEEEDRE